jgi:cytochrome b subunit of formate dehydrogenase
MLLRYYRSDFEMVPVTPHITGIAFAFTSHMRLIYIIVVPIIIIMRNVKTAVIPVIIGATGTISKAFRKYVSNIPGHREIMELQKTALLGTGHILRKVLT